jgi:4-alpha-glucanotransferase
MDDDGGTLERLRRLRGIAGSFTDFRGETHALSEASLLGLLAAFGHTVDDPAALAREAEALETRDWARVLGPVVVLRGDLTVPFTVLAPLLPEIRWCVQTEQGDMLRGEAVPAQLPMLDERGIRDLWYVRLALALPPLPTGYHRLRLEKSDGQPLGTTRLIVAPERCHEPPAIRAGERPWGVAIQLYTLRSARNWGIGDFTDLAGFARAAAELGADLVGLNPLHALFPADPVLCAPYSPSTRYFLNVLYIDPEAIPEYRASVDAQRLVGMPEFQARLEGLRAAPFVDYPGVTACKLEVLRVLHGEFAARAARGRRLEFSRFVKKHGKLLERFALFHALHDHFSAMGIGGGWPAWPAAYHDPDGAAAQAFGEAEPAAVGFHCWLQWVAACQLETAEQGAREAGLRLGLYRDLAVGPNGGGAETWTAPDLYAAGATVGAPPDPLALHGQDWGIPPMDPDPLRERAYAPFIRLLRANMGTDGALRIDHVMMLMRLWWIPRGAPSAAGGYVHYRLDELMAIVALESERRRCLVIGEDLGTVPPEVRAAMSTHGLYSYRVLYFERAADGSFRAPADYPREALVTLGTHDLPTLASFWAGTDIDLRERLGLYPEPGQAQQLRVERGTARHALLEALRAAGLASGESEAGGEGCPPPAWAVQRFLASAPSAVLMLQPEDWLGIETPVNVPGTHEHYPNWARKLSADWPEFMHRADLVELATEIGRLRRSGAGPSRRR